MNTIRTYRDKNNRYYTIGRHYLDTGFCCVVVFTGRTDSKGEPSSDFVADPRDYDGADSLPTCNQNYGA